MALLLTACLAGAAAGGGPDEALLAPTSLPASPAATGPATRPAGGPALIAVPTAPYARVPDPGARPSGKVEVIGLTLQGRRMRERLELDDLASVTAADGTRLLPLLRLAKLLEVEAVEKDQRIEIAMPQGKAMLDVAAGQLTVGSRVSRVEVAAAASEVVGRRDVFLRPEVIAELTGVELRWDEAEYAYRATTTRALKIWGISQREWKKLLQVGPDMPQVHGRADPADNTVHFWQSDLGLSYERHWQPGSRTDQTTVADPQHSLWGRMAGGQFRIDLSNPGYLWDDTQSRFDPGEPVFALNWGEWVHRRGACEVVVGDSTFGLSELVFPRVQQTGVKVTALSGFTPGELAALEQMPDLGRFYGRTRTFEGYAPIRSKVELRVNDRTIETQEALPDSTTPAGKGRYRFEDIRLPAGVLSEVRIVITEPGGTQTFEKREVFESRLLLPRGHGVYLVSTGTHRQPDVTTDIDGNRKTVGFGRSYGVVAGGRALYGLDEKLLVGAVMGTQEDLYRFELNRSEGSQERRYPASSAHAGGLAAWSPSSAFDLSGEIGASSGDGPDRYDDWAARVDADWHAWREGRIHALAFDYQPDYFDGTRLDLNDRRGFQVDGRWKANGTQLFGAFGRARNNLDGALDETLSIDFNSLEATHTLAPGVTALLGTYGSRPSWADGPARLNRVNVTAGPWKGWDAALDYYFGDDLMLGQSNLLEEVNLTGVPDQTSEATALTVSRNLTDDQKLGLRYRETVTQERASLFYAWRGRVGQRAFNVHSEFGHNYKENPGGYFLNRSELYLDPQGNSRVGMEVEHDGAHQWRAMAFLEIRTLMTSSPAGAALLSRRQVTPDRGGVRGSVFVDYNANALRDPGEPGLEGVTVNLGAGRSAVTDTNGFFFIPSRGVLALARVSLEPETVPAVYSLVHATQEVRILPNSATEVNLAVMPLLSLSGSVKARLPDGQERGVAGVDVKLYLVGQDRAAGESVTAGDGSYYFGDLRPGAYVLRVDPATLPAGHRCPETQMSLRVAGVREARTIVGPVFRVIVEPGAATRPAR